MNIVICSALVAIVIGMFLMFIVFTVNEFYFSAIIDMFLFNHKQWKLYRKAKKHGIKRYLTTEEFDKDYYNNTIPEYYVYPVAQIDGGIRYLLYTKDYTFITENFQLINKL